MTVPVDLPLRPRAVIFDLDGLLLASEQVHLDALRHAAAVLDVELPDSLLFSLIGRSEADSYQRLCAHLSQVDVDWLVQQAHILYEQHVRRGMPLRPGARLLLESLKQQQLPCAVATSSRWMAAINKLKYSGLLDYFSAIATSSDVSLPKPAPDVYLLAAQKLHIKPEQCLALEDSSIGVQAARAAGMTVIQVPDLLPPDQASAADWVADSLEHVQHWLHL